MNKIIEKFRHIFDMPSNHDGDSQDTAAFDAVNQKAAAILRKITAYNVPLTPLKNDTSSYPMYWYKKEGEQWRHFDRERGEITSSICAENDDKMVHSTVFDSLDSYAMQYFVLWRERNGKDPYRKYDDFMEECLRIAYPGEKYLRHTEYDDARYAAQDAEFEKLLRSFRGEDQVYDAALEQAFFDAVNQKAATILQKITAYDVPLIPLKNDTFSDPTFWYLKNGEKWVKYNREQGEVTSSICAENDDEMVYLLVSRSLTSYAKKYFVLLRKRDGKDPYRKYDDFMEECLYIVYPGEKYHRHTEYDDTKYAAQDTEFEKLLRSFRVEDQVCDTAQDQASFDAVNQNADAILRKITAYDVPLIPLKNESSSYPIYWYKKEGEQWRYFNRGQGEVISSICAKNDDEMVFQVVWRSLTSYAMQYFVLWRERNGKDPFRKYDDFMEECLRIVYPDKKYRRHLKYNDPKYEELDFDYLHERINKG